MTRTALETGANGGIGSAISERMRADGVTVRTTDVAGPADVVVDLSVDSIPEWAVADVDICVCAAGVVDTFAPAHSMSADKWSLDIDVNLTGSFRVIQACLSGMRNRRFGRVVAISSMAGVTGSVGVRRSVENEFNQWLQGRLAHSVWQAGGCSSWYQHPATGKNTVLWPSSAITFWRRTRRMRLSDYHTTRRIDR